MEDLRALYQRVILDHSRQPRNRGTLERADRRASGYNPLCGDEVTLTVRLDAEGRVAEVRFMGHGCAICTASTSMLTELAPGRSQEELASLRERFREVVTGDAAPDQLADEGSLAAFGGVARFPNRAKCATLAWETLRNALDQRDEVARTE